MAESLAGRRHLRLTHLITPPRGRWRNLVSSPNHMGNDDKLDDAHDERKRKWRHVSNHSVECGVDGRECSFCIVYNVWPRCTLYQEKKAKTDHSG